jgi:putative oxidoreductase
MNTLGRILIASLFIASACKTIFYDGFNTFVGAIESKKIPYPVILAIIVLIIKILGGFSIIFNNYTNLGIYSLLLFTVLATGMYHNAFVDPSQFNNMMKNIALIGGLLLLLK